MLIDELLTTLPPEWPSDLLPEIQQQVAAAGTKVVVLDDDPTGTQTVHDVAVLTDWSVDSLQEALRDPAPVVYVLTNSRSLSTRAAVARTQEIAQHLVAASQSMGRPFVVDSRSDSTLRGHYPAETDALAEVLGPFDGLLLVPFFREGGRLTIRDVHYVLEGDRAVPAADTEFARDAAFGYRHSNLRDWVEEKTAGRVPSSEVRSVSLAMLRQGGPEAVAAALEELSAGQPCVVNAVSYRDLEVLVAGLLRAEAHGKRLLYRTAASFVRVRGGITPAPLLRSRDLPRGTDRAGGLVVVGSYVAKTTAQLEAALAMPEVVGLEAAVPRLLDGATREAEIARLSATVDESLMAGRDTIVYTSRALASTTTGASDPLAIGAQVSDALVSIVQRLRVAPAWLIAKGGITSSDVATRGLGVRRAWVLGQAIAGIPVWQTGPESRWPGLTYVVFPGNVGGPGALAEMMAILREARQPTQGTDA
ncbi:MAG: four-carbon acid sugar kinase family protein [Anaerolineales bacterium]